ncbi:hypothetical protein SLA2020_405810 [Shorea laevis]
MQAGNGGIGSVREVVVASGLPVATSRKRLKKLDHDLHVMMISFIARDHKLENYRSSTTLHEIEDSGGGKTVVVPW